MARRDATVLNPEETVEEWLKDKPVEQEPEEKEEKQERKVTPHEQGRKARQMSLTFPGPEWKAAIKEQSEAWGMRPSDFVIFCVSYAIAGIQRGEVARPPGQIDEFRHRAGEGLDLPWEP
jgi:hypothetical protein